MDFIEDIVWRVRDWLSGGRWIWVVAAAALLLVAALPVSLLWQAVRPKPAPQYQPVPASSASAQTKADNGLLPAVPKDVVEEIAADLGVKAGAALSVSYVGDTKTIRASKSLGGTKFKAYTYVQREDGSWSRN